MSSPRSNQSHGSSVPNEVMNSPSSPGIRSSASSPLNNDIHSDSGRVIPPTPPMSVSGSGRGGNSSDGKVVPSTPSDEIIRSDAGSSGSFQARNIRRRVFEDASETDMMSTGYGSLNLSLQSNPSIVNQGQDRDSNIVESVVDRRQDNPVPQDRAGDDYDNLFDGEEARLIRGTDIHVRTAFNTFKEFIQSFVSVRVSQRTLRREERARRRRQMRQSGQGTSGEDSDDDSLSSIDTSDSREDNIFPYLIKLRNILLGRSSSNAESSMISSTAMATTVPLDLDAFHLYYHSPKCQRLYHQLLSYPSEIIHIMDLVITREMESLLQQLHDEADLSSNPEEFATLYPNNDDVPLPKVQVRPFNLNTISHMRALDPNSIDNLLSIRGMVVRTSPIIPDLKVAHFACTICSHASAETLDRGRISEPTVCPTCNTKNGFELIHNRSLFADKQMVRIQETPNEVPAGETPASIVLFAYDDLVDAVRPGDRVEVTGIFRAQARRVNPKISKVKSVYKTYVDVIHFKRVSGENVKRSDNGEDRKEEKITRQGRGIVSDHIGGHFSPDRIQQLVKLSKSPEIYNHLVQSLAPSIWELDDVKKGVLCMLFGGNSKRVRKGTAEKRRRMEQEDRYDSNSEDEDEENGSSSKLNKRGDINILLCGDPGTSKSQLLSYVHKLSPRGVYTSGKGSSAVGLTASIVRDPETRELVLESGALVLSDLGICCIDEFDKMSDTTRAILHEAMEQQTVSIAKAGIIATLNARTSILASANPVESRYNPQLSVVDNIKLPPTLLSRFDLIYLILDAPNAESDRQLAQHLVGLYFDTPNIVQPPLDQDLLRDYVAYAREHINPELSDLATRELIKEYLDMRKVGSNGGGNNGSKTISATPRQLESLIRLSEAIAKMRLSIVVERADVKEAVRLMKVATQAAATDPRTGRIDMDMITTGRSTANREMEEALNLSLKELLTERRGKRMAVGDVRRQLSEIMNVSSLKQEDVVEALRIVEGDGLIQLNERTQTIFVRAGVVA